MKKQFLAIGLWLLVLGFVFTFPSLVPSLTGFEIFLFPFIAIPLLIFSLFALIKEQNRIYPALTIPVIIIVFFAAVAKGFSWGARAHFYLNKSKYQSIVAKVLTVQDEKEREKICGDGGEDCWILSSSPTRISFHYHHAFLNWYDFVYDPTGAVNQKDISKPHELNVYLFGAEHLTGDWYLGHFGD
jgi:hypothetical protein